MRITFSRSDPGAGVVKRVTVILFSVCLLFLLCISASAADLQGGYYIVCDCALGNGVRLYVPSSAAEGSFTYDANGCLFNISSATVYLYSPDYPSCTISASRFSGFKYRFSGYDSADLNITNVTDSNVQIYSENPALADEWDVFSIIQLVLLMGVFAILLFSKVGEKNV